MQNALFLWQKQEKYVENNTLYDIIIMLLIIGEEEYFRNIV